MTVEEYNECVDQYADNLYRFILKNIKDVDKAKDVVQDTYEKLWRKVTDVPATNAKSYMFTTAYHTMLDMIKKDKRTETIEDIAHDPIGNSESYSDLKEFLNEAVDKLPAIQKSVLLLRDYEGYNYEEIGEITKLSESQVKVYIFRARSFLKKYIGEVENVI